MDLSSIRRYAANTNHNNIGLQPQSLLAASESMARINFLSAENLFVAGDCTSIIERDGVMHGFGAWMTVNLIPGISFSNSPINPTVDWARSFFPIETPVAVRAGDAVKTKISTYDGKEWRWQVEIYSSIEERKPF